MSGGRIFVYATPESYCKRLTVPLPPSTTARCYNHTNTQSRILIVNDTLACGLSNIGPRFFENTALGGAFPIVPGYQMEVPSNSHRR